MKLPNNIPPIIIDANEPNPSKYVAEDISPLKIIHKITRNNAKEVPSLKRLSHSKISVSLLGAPILLNIESTATGSVAEIKLQNNKHTKNGISKPSKGKIKYIAPPITNADIKSPKMAKLLIDFQFFNTCL